jgi:hypothetical protein
MAETAHAGAVYLSGTSTAFTGEACTLVAGTTYQIDDTAKRLWNPLVTLTVYDGAGAEVPTSVNYLYGTVTLAEAPGGAVTVDGEYMPLHEIGTVRGFSLSVTCGAEDSTIMGSTVTTRTREVTLYDVAVELDLLEQGVTVYDGDARTFDSILTAGAAMYVKCKIGSSAITWTARLLPTSADNAGDVGSLVNTRRSFQASAGVLGSVFSWSWQ